MVAGEGWGIRRVEEAQFVDALRAAEVDPPIEQTPAWAGLDADDSQRELAGLYLILHDDAPAGAFLLTRLVPHRLVFFWVRHGPVWFAEPGPAEERAVLEAVAREARSLDRTALSLRLDLRAALPGTQPPAGLITYDRTVVIDTGVGIGAASEEDAAERILATFKSRGRRDVRKAVRESGLVCGDETDRAARSFDEYHAVMADTAQRDGFVPWDAEIYRRMVADLGPEHCRVYAGRVEGALVCWSIVTVSGSSAARYYAASSTSTRHRRVTDRLVLFECVDLARRGVRSFDLMGIGSELSPTLGGLNEFKTKFSSQVAHVAPARDYPLRPLAYRTSGWARRVVRRVRRGRTR